MPIFKTQNNFGSRCRNHAVSRSVPVVLTCSLAAGIIKAQFQTKDTMQTPQALSDSVSAFHFKRERRFSKRRRNESMSTFSGRKNSGMDIPDYAIERIARCLLPMSKRIMKTTKGRRSLRRGMKRKTLKKTGTVKYFSRKRLCKNEVLRREVRRGGCQAPLICPVAYSGGGVKGAASAAFIGVAGYGHADP